MNLLTTITWRIALIALISAGLSACSPSKITHSYADPALKKLDHDGVLVVAVARQQTARIDFEDTFVKSLARSGVKAIASHTLVPSAEAEAEEVIAAAKEADLDTILVARYAGEKAQDVHHPGRIYYQVEPGYGAGYYPGFGGYYGYAHIVAYDQPMWTANITHTIVADMYLTKTEAHMWQATTETVHASSTSKLRDKAINSLISDLKKQDLIR